MPQIPWLGEAASLSAALCWAVAVTLFRRPVETYGPWSVNLAKSTVSAVLLGVTLLVVGELGALLGASPHSLAVAALSGVIGLTLGDTALFAAVERIGVYRTLLFQTLAPVFAAVLEIAVYGEPVHTDRFLAMAVVLSGVALVVSPSRRSRRRAEAPHAAGHVLAALAAGGQAAGMVLAKEGMAELPIVTASFVRLTASVAGLALVLVWRRRLTGAAAIFTSREALGRVTPPIVLGTYLAFLLMMAGIDLAPASVAAVLLATSPIFSLFIDRWSFGTPITARGLAGTLIAVAGVGLLAYAGS